MNLITAVGFENLNFEMYLALWPCEKVWKSLFQYLTSLAQKSLFWAKGHCQINFSFLLLGGKRNHKMQPCGTPVNSFWIAGGTAPLPGLCVPGQSSFIPSAAASEGLGSAAVPQPRLQPSSGPWANAHQISNVTLYDQSVCFLKLEISLSLFTWWCPFSIIKMFMFCENHKKWFSFPGRGELVCHVFATQLA